MNAEKLTQKSMEAINAAQNLAAEYGNPQVEPCHLLYALMDQEQGLIPQLVIRMGKEPESLRALLEAQVAKLPRVAGGSRSLTMAPEFAALLQEAEAAAGQMRDSYMSVEHLVLGALR